MTGAMRGFLGGLALVLLAVGCNCGEGTIIPIGRDDAGSDTGDVLDAGPDAGHDAGLDGGHDAGSDGGLDGGADGGVPLDFSVAVRACTRLDACALGADYGTGIRNRWMELCLAVLTSPQLSASEFATLYGPTATPFVLDGWALPTPLWLTHPRVRICLQQKGSCADVLACFNRGAPTQSCAQPTSYCDGSVLRACVPPSKAFQQKFGAAALLTFSYDCLEKASWCAQGTGSIPMVGCAPSTCDIATFVPSCNANVAERCFDGLADHWPCAEGASCAVVDAGSGHLDARCVGTGDACTPGVDANRCAGAQLSTCLHGRFETHTCPLSMTCQTTAAGESFCGVAADCSPSSSPQCTADGGLEVCAFGRRVGVSCAQLDLTACADSGGGAVCL